MVLSSRSAAKATLALNAGLCERRERRPDDFLFITNSFRLAIVGQAICPEFVFISAVQICGATSVVKTCNVYRVSFQGLSLIRHSWAWPMGPSVIGIDLGVGS